MCGFYLFRLSYLFRKYPMEMVFFFKSSGSSLVVDCSVSPRLLPPVFGSREMFSWKNEEGAILCPISAKSPPFPPSNAWFHTLPLWQVWPRGTGHVFRTGGAQTTCSDKFFGSTIATPCPQWCLLRVALSTTCFLETSVQDNEWAGTPSLVGRLSGRSGIPQQRKVNFVASLFSTPFSSTYQSRMRIVICTRIFAVFFFWISHPAPPPPPFQSSIWAYTEDLFGLRCSCLQLGGWLVWCSEFVCFLL